MSVTTLNIIGLNSAIKRHRVAKWVKKQNPYIYCHKRHISDIETHRLKNDVWWRKIFHGMETKKRRKVAILMSDKIDFKLENFIRDRERHYTMIERFFKQEDIAIVNAYVPNIGAFK